MESLLGLTNRLPSTVVSEVTDEEAKAFAEEGEAEKKKEKELTKADLVKEAILNTYLNLAKCAPDTTHTIFCGMSC